MPGTLETCSRRERGSWGQSRTGWGCISITDMVVWGDIGWDTDDRRTSAPPASSCMLVLKNAKKVFFFLSGGSHLLLLSRDHSPSPYTSELLLLWSFFKKKRLVLKGRREGRAVGRKEERKHPSRRAEAIRNVCWISKTENREEKDKNQIKGREKRWGLERKEGFAFLWENEAKA